MHNGKMSKPVIHSTSSSNRYTAITERSCINRDVQKGFGILNMNTDIFQLVYAQLAFILVSVKGIWQMKAMLANRSLKLKFVHNVYIVWIFKTFHKPLKFNYS